MRRPRRAVLRSALGVALIVGVFALIVPRIASYGSVAHHLASVSPAWAAALAAAALLDLLSAALPWRTLLSQLSFLAALGFTQASTALTIVLPGGAPLGMAISFGLLRRLRVTAGAAGFAVALTGIWSQAMIFLYPLLGAALVLGSGDLSGSSVAIAVASGAAAAVLIVVALVALRSPGAALWLGDAAGRFAAWLARLFRRTPPAWDGAALLRVREERLGHLRRRWPALTAATLANQLSGYLLLELSLRAVGITFDQVTVAESFLAWSIGRVISSLPLTPGGIGFVELGLIGTLVGFGAPEAHVVAAVLLFRALVIVPTLTAGGIALVALRVKPSAAAAG